MAFWGVELKPGKPYVHGYDDDQGRLHLSQATLGSGTSTKKTILQCQVGDRMPIYLCSLLPEKLENCALNLEFEEDVEVTFSVIGPHSVHLSGFFFGETEADGDLDPFEGQAMEIESESDDPLDYDSEDEDDFTVDDEIDMYPSSAIHNSGVKIEEILDDENPTKENATSRQSKKKKSQKGESSNLENSGKQLVVRDTSGVPVLESEDEDGFPIYSPSDRKADDLTLRSSDATKNEHNGEEAQLKKGKDNLACDKRLKRKIDVVHQDAEQTREIGDVSDHGAHTSVAAPGNDSKQKKKNKKKKTGNKDDIGHEINGKGIISNKASSADMERMLVTETDDGLKLDTRRDKEKEKKKKNKKNEGVGTTDAKQPVTDKGESPLKLAEKAEAKPLQVRSFPNGLVIEELAMGKPDGKKAASGRKVSVYYIGKLKKNSKIFDSNIGKAPFKFRLGIGQVIKGWDVGVQGMRVGDKRRLTIPPAMGYGAKGAGGAIPPNSWLVFDVELVDVN